jgi:hypothetical protein
VLRFTGFSTSGNCHNPAAGHCHPFYTNSSNTVILLFLRHRNSPPTCHRLQCSLHRQPCWYSTVSFALVVQCVHSVLVFEACGGVCSLLLLWLACQMLRKMFLLIKFP